MRSSRFLMAIVAVGGVVGAWGDGARADESAESRQRSVPPRSASTPSLREGAPYANGVTLRALPPWRGSFRVRAGTSFSDRRFVLGGDVSGACAWGRGDESLLLDNEERLQGAVVGFSAAGSPRWVACIRGPGEQCVSDVATIAPERVVVTGHFEEGAVLSGQPAPAIQGPRVQAHAAAVDAEGRGRWLASPVKDQHLWSIGRRVVGLAGGGILVVGEMEGAKGEQVFARLYSPTLARGPLVQLAGTLGEDRAAPCAPTEDGGFIIARRVRRSEGRSYQTVVSRHAKTGRMLWSTQLPDEGSIQVTGLASTPEGGAILTAWFVKTIRVGVRELGSKQAGPHAIVLALDRRGSVKRTWQVTSAGEAAYAIPLALLPRSNGRMSVLGRGKGAIHGASTDTRSVQLDEGIFHASLLEDEGVALLRSVAASADGRTPVVGGRWLGLGER